MKNKILSLICLFAITGCCTVLRINCPEDKICIETDGYKNFASNAQLYDCLYHSILRREAFSPVKDARLGLNFAQDALPLRQEFIDADTDLELMQAIVHLSALREDTHMKIIDKPNNYFGSSRSVPIRFLPEFGTNNHTFFVANFDASLKSDKDLVNYSNLRKGDLLISVNDIPIAKYTEILSKHLGHSAENKFLWEAAENLHKKRKRLSLNLYTDDGFVKYTLQKSNGDQYFVSLKYGRTDRRLNLNLGANYLNLGYTKVNLLGITDNFEIYSKPNVILIELKGLSEYDNNKTMSGRERLDFFEAQLDSIFNWAMTNDRLNNRIILDATQAGGGMGAPLLVQRLAKRPFKTTYGNLRVSDDEVQNYVTNNLGSRVTRWYQEAVVNGSAYTTNRPFKLRYNEVNDNGYMPPENNFTGQIIGLFSSQSGSNLDQLSAMLHDNNILCHSFGYPTGGFSNTWEFEDEIIDDNGKKYCSFEWNIGHTIRPNGQILEGNPANVIEQVDLTRNNFEKYWDILVLKAQSQSLCGPDLGPGRIIIPELPFEGRIPPPDVGCEVIDCCAGCPGGFREVELRLQSNFINSLDVVYINSKFKKEKINIQNGKAKKIRIDPMQKSILKIEYSINEKQLNKLKRQNIKGLRKLRYIIFDENKKIHEFQSELVLAK